MKTSDYEAMLEEKQQQQVREEMSGYVANAILHQHDGELFRLSDKASDPFWAGAVEDMLEHEVLVPVTADYEAAERIYDLLGTPRAIVDAAYGKDKT